MSTALKELHPESTVYSDFGGASVPWAYGDAAKEYRTLRTSQALLDLSSCTIVEIRGDAAGFAQRVLARDVEYLTAERCLVALVLDDGGQPVDIVTVYGRGDTVLLESSFGNGPALLAHLRAQADDSVELVERTDLVSIGLEGPYSWGVVGRLIDHELPALPLETVSDITWQGHELIFARTGFTGEYGYRVIASHEAARAFWAQAAVIAPPVGQQALELAMLEVRQPILRLETADASSVASLGFNWLVDSTKESFVGRDALFAAFHRTDSPRTIGFTCAQSPAPGTAVLAGGEQIGTVVHAVHSIALGRTLGLARVHSDFAAAGLELTLGGTGPELTIDTVASPYIIPKSWSVPII